MHRSGGNVACDNIGAHGVIGATADHHGVVDHHDHTGNDHCGSANDHNHTTPSHN
jgi:hypothetical protein